MDFKEIVYGVLRCVKLAREQEMSVCLRVSCPKWRQLPKD